MKGSRCGTVIKAPATRAKGCGINGKGLGLREKGGGVSGALRGFLHRAPEGSSYASDLSHALVKSANYTHPFGLLAPFIEVVLWVSTMKRAL